MLRKKKNSVNMKSLIAHARMWAREAEMENLEARRKEDEEWLALEGPKSRAAVKREEKAERRAEAAARKAESRMLAKMEEEKLSKKPFSPPPKVTAAERRFQREELEKARMKRKILVSCQITTEEEYEQMVGVMNTNRTRFDGDGSVMELEADTIDRAIAAFMYNDLPAAVMVEIRRYGNQKAKKIHNKKLNAKHSRHSYFDFAVY
ncbi:OLC1v1038980C1 [Oldenlandia corymbosa var. corymbosa]|uniref:OLC1v1038980C1 n=1 Tax=Oldenlandia corymbosa var. corymbosa TaxID=529605 RepID=A0AAV1D275_OLDCO|nr:OLC1v1038980C1 [Oldenlandia corymbosa var. corymbosa]